MSIPQKCEFITRARKDLLQKVSCYCGLSVYILFIFIYLFTVYILCKYILCSHQKQNGDGYR